MSYKIQYSGKIDKERITLVTAIGHSNLKKGDSFSINSTLTPTSVYISYEAYNKKSGFFIWENCVEVNKELKDDGRYVYTIPNDRASNEFIKITFNVSIDKIGTNFNITITTDNERLAKAFFSPFATMLSNTISRTLTLTDGSDKFDLKDNYTGINIFREVTDSTGSWFISSGGQNKGSNLKWYKTNLENYYSTFCYIKNLDSKELNLYPTIQGWIYNQGTPLWRNVAMTDEGNDSNTSGKLMTIPGYGTALVEIVIRIRDKGEGFYIDTTGKITYEDENEPCCVITDKNGDYNATYVPISKLFWRFNVGTIISNTTYCNFVILNEYVADPNKTLIDYYNSGKTGQGFIRTKINQKQTY